MPHRNLIQAKFLFEKAQLLWEPQRDITNGVVVNLLQDAAELALWAIVKMHSVNMKSKEGFVSLLESINVPGKAIRGKAQMLEINSSRVSFKHYGLTPSTSDIPRFVEGTRFFLIENVREFLSLTFENISLADEVRVPELRALLKEAERYRNDGDFDEAMVQVSLAYQKLLRLATDRHWGDFPRLDRVERLFPKDAQEDARGILWDLGRFFERFSSEHSMLTLGVDKFLMQELESRRFNVIVSVSGNRLGVHPRRSADSTLDNVNFLISNVTDIARRLTA
jgi:hypothetical protein